MNHIFKSVFNRHDGSCTVMSELGKSKKKINGVKGMVLLLCLSSSASFATQYVIRPGQELNISDGQYIASDVNDVKHIIFNNSGNLTVGDDVTLDLISESNVYLGMFLYNTSTSEQSADLVTNVGDNFTIKNNYSGNVISNGIKIANANSLNSNLVLNVGNNFSVVNDDMFSGRSRGVVVEGRSDVNIGANATFFGTQFALIATGANDYLANVNVGDNATFIGRVGGQYNTLIDLGVGSKVVIDENMMSRQLISRGLVDLNGRNVAVVAKNIDLTLNLAHDVDSGEFSPSVFQLMNMAYGFDGNFSEVLDGFSQKLIVDGASVKIGNGDVNSNVVNKGDLVNISLADYKDVDSEAPSKTAYVYLKDININSDGGHALVVRNKSSGWDPTSSSYKYVHSDNSAIVIFDNVDASAQTDGIYLDESQGKGNVSVSLVNGTKVAGGMINDSLGDVALTVDNSEFNGDIVNNSVGNISVSVNDSGYVTGDVINNSNAGVFDMTVNEGGTWVGNAIKNGEGDLNLVIEEGAKWTGSGDGVGLWVKPNSSYTLANSSSSFTNVKMDDNSLLDFGAPASESTFKTLHSAGDMTQSGSAANVYMSTNLGLGKGDLIAADGALTGNYIVSVNNYGGSPAAPNEALRIVQGGAGSTATVALTGNQYRDAGLYRYYLVQDNSGAGYWLVNGDGSGTNYGGGDDDLSKSGNAYNADGSINSAGFTAPVGAEQYSDLARTLKSTAASQTVSMLNQSRNVAKHIDGIRQAGVKGDHATTAWVNHFYNDSKIDASVAGTESKLNMNATYLGADKSWDLGDGDSFVAGVFAGAGFADNDYHINGSEGDSDIYTGGVYGMWLDDTGLFADMTAQVYRVKTQSKAYTEQGQRTDYDIVSHAFGLNLDIGKRYELDDGFYIEPELKLAYLRDGSDEFTTRGASNLKAKKTAADVFQYGASLSLGKTIATATPGSSIQPYLNIELLGQSINGGDIESSGTRLDNDLSGHQLRSDLGVNWQINKKHRLFAEVSAGTGETYSNTFSAGLGYQMKF